MALPGDLTLVRVTGTYVNAAGAALSGTVQFQLSTTLYDSANKVIVMPSPVLATLVAGNFTVDLPATDDPDLTPSNTFYTVTVSLTGFSPQTYQIILPYNTAGTPSPNVRGPVDLSDVLPVASGPVSPIYTQVKIDAMTDLNLTGRADGYVIAWDAANSEWTVVAQTGGSGGAPDATTTVKGIVKLAGDLGGTALLPTVPGLASKSDTSHLHDARYVRTVNTTGPDGAGNVTVTPADATASVKGVVRLTGDLGGTALTPTVPGLAGKSDTSHLHDSRYVRTVNSGAPDGSGNVVVTAPDATTGSKGIVQLAGDLAGTSASPTVVGLSSKITQTQGDARYVRTVNSTGPDGSGNVVVSGGSGSGEPYEVQFDSLTGATDDLKLAAFKTAYQSATYKPTLVLSNRAHTFATSFTMFDGFRMRGPNGNSNPERGTGYMTAKLDVTVNGTWLVADPGAGNNLWDVHLSNLTCVGTSSTQLIGQISGVALYQCTFRSIYTTGFKSILGSQATKILVTACTFDGDWEINNCYDGAIHIGGSDSTFSWDLLLDSATAYVGSGQAHLWCDYLEKSSFIGRMYITCEADWTGIRIDGPGYNASTASNLGGPLNFYGSIVEGRNIGAPCYGATIRVLGGQAVFHGLSTSFAMSAASSMGHSPTDAGVIMVTGGSCTVYSSTYDRATGVAETTPFVYCSAGRVRVQDIFVGTKGGTWTGLPRVQDAGSGDITCDDTCTPI